MGRRLIVGEVRNQIRSVRVSHGLSQQELAERVGLSRQAVNAIEMGRYTPNAAVAMRLAQELACRVEDLFSLANPIVERRAHLAGTPCATGERVVVGKVGGRLVAHPLRGARLCPDGFAAADGLALNAAADIRLFLPLEQVEKTAFLVGCDPSLGILSSWVSRRAPGVRLVWLQGSSQEALDALAGGQAHVAGSHLLDDATGEYNIVQARRVLADAGGLVVRYADWEQGLIVRPGNPRGLRRVGDLAQAGVSLINREPGSGSRVLLDQLLAQAGIPTAIVAGYSRVATTHMAVARAVAEGVADAGIGLRAIASALGLDFVPVADVRFDLVIPREHMEHPAVTALLDVLQSPSLRAELASLPGYNVARTGSALAQLPAAA